MKPTGRTVAGRKSSEQHLVNGTRQAWQSAARLLLAAGLLLGQCAPLAALELASVQFLRPSTGTTERAPAAAQLAAPVLLARASPPSSWLESLVRLGQLAGSGASLPVAYVAADRPQTEPQPPPAPEPEPEPEPESAERAAPAEPEADADSEASLVETNNVSAVVAGGAEPERARAQLDPITTSASRTPMSCELAHRQCQLRKACAPALAAYREHCSELMENRTATCSPGCLTAMIALRSSDQGYDLASCDCDDDPYCLDRKQRSLSCLAQVEEALRPGSVVSCSVASAICTADQSCSEALDFYYQNCNSLLSQRHCSSICNNSVAVLYRQAKAAKMVSCRCDGTEDFPCLKYKTYTQRLCLISRPAEQELASRWPSLSPHMGAPGAPGAPPAKLLASQDEAQAQPDVGAADSEPAETDFDDNSASGSGDNDDDDDDDNDDNDNRQRAADAGDEASPLEDSYLSTAAASSSPNGIQDWIPLMSGRYFTNLHQQQLRQQQLDRQQRQRQQQQQQQAGALHKTGAGAPGEPHKSPPDSHHHYHRRKPARVSLLAGYFSTSAASQSGYAATLQSNWLSCLFTLVLLVYLSP